MKVLMNRNASSKALFPSSLESVPASLTAEDCKYEENRVRSAYEGFLDRFVVCATSTTGAAKAGSPGRAASDVEHHSGCRVRHQWQPRLAGDRRRPGLGQQQANGFRLSNGSEL